MIHKGAGRHSGIQLGTTPTSHGAMPTLIGHRDTPLGYCITLQRTEGPSHATSWRCLELKLSQVGHTVIDRYNVTSNKTTMGPNTCHGACFSYNKRRTAKGGDGTKRKSKLQSQKSTQVGFQAGQLSNVTAKLQVGIQQRSTGVQEVPAGTELVYSMCCAPHCWNERCRQLLGG